MHKMPPLVLFLFALSLAACTLVTEEPVEIITPQPTPTTAVCTPLPDGMHVHIQREGHARGAIEAEGLQPDDKPILLFMGEGPSGTLREERQTASVVGPDGRFRETFDFSYLPSPTAWQLQGKLIHNRGVACFTISLPLPTTTPPSTPAAMVAIDRS